MTGNEITLSIVSHGHGDLVVQSLRSLAASLGKSGLKVRLLLTLNMPEPQLQASFEAQDWPFEVVWIHNKSPLGFGANHNQAFVLSGVAANPGTWFVLLNPDIFWPKQSNQFWKGLANSWLPDVGLVCPTQVDVQNQPQDFARRLITPWGLAWRLICRMAGFVPSGVAKSVATADWVNGACMIFRSEAFAALRGFDERYFMYCEDTDICLRLQLAGWRMQGADLTVVHDARRATGRSWRHLSWHIRSMLRLWCSKAYWAYLLRFKVL